MPPGLAHTETRTVTLDSASVVAADCSEWLIDYNGNVARVHALSATTDQPLCAVLIMDEMFLVRLAAARRLWKCLNGRKPGTDPARLSSRHRARLILALRALDGRLDGATYRELAIAFFGAKRVGERGWKTNDLRDRTIRAVNLGEHLMQGGYRQLLRHPYRFVH